MAHGITKAKEGSRLKLKTSVAEFSRAALRIIKRLMEPWLLFVALCGISTGYFIGSSMQTLPTNKITKIYSGSSSCYIMESEFASSGQQFGTTNNTSIYVATNPRGAKGLPPDVVEPYSDLYFNELLKSSRKESVVKPKYLLALTVGYNQRNIVSRMVSKFSENFSIVLFHYDGRASAWDNFEWSHRAIHISSRTQMKWWYAKRFLHPHIVAGYEYMFIWDEDIGVENFNGDEYVKLAKKYRLDISQPAIESKAGLTWLMTQKRNDVEAHKEAKDQKCPYPHAPPCAGFVEIMVPVFSRKSWSCVWLMLQNDLVHGWGLDLNLWRCVERPHEDIGVIDAQWVEHMALPSLGGKGLVTKKRIVGTKESHNVSNAKDMGTWQRTADFKVMKKLWHNWSRQNLFFRIISDYVHHGEKCSKIFVW